MINIERRRHTRIRAPLTGMWDGAIGRQTGRVYDISLGGCYAESMTPPRAGETIAISIEGPQGWITLKALVVHVDPQMGFGAQFNDPSTDALTQLENLLASFQTLP